MHPLSPHRPLFRHLAALTLYSLLALALTWPLAAHLSTHVPGDGIDDPALAWNLWWIKHRLVDQLRPDIFHVGWLFHPIGINLAFYTLTPLNGLLSIPLQTALPLVLANNLVALSTFVLGGYGAFLLTLALLARGRTGSPSLAVVASAWVAGVIYAFASPKLFYLSLGQFNIASSHWIPFCVLYLLRMVDAPAPRAGARNAAFAALFLTLQAWSELTYASFLLIFAAILALWALAARRISIRAALVRFGLVGLLFALGIAPFLAAMAPDLAVEGDFFAAGGGFADLFSADLQGYLAPTRLHPLFGALATGLPFANDKGQHIYLGYSVLALTVLGAGVLLARPGPSRQVGWLWLASTLTFWLLTLGPELRWGGQPLGIPGPFALISQLPFFSGNRYPSRYSVMLLLCVAVLAAYGLAWLLQRLADRRRPSTWRPAWVASVLAAVIVAEHLAVPLPLNDFRIPALYARLAATPGDAAVLELPTGWRNGARVLGRSDELIMMQQWYQTRHGKPRLGGNTSRNPEYKFQYFSEAPLIGDLIALMNADRPHIAAVLDGKASDMDGQDERSQLEAMIVRDRPLAGPVLDFLGVDSVLVHVEKATPQLLRFVEEALPLELVDEWQGADWTGAPSTLRLYRLAPAVPAAAWAVELGEPQGKLHLAEGWSSLDGDVRYALRERASLLLDLPVAGGRLRLTLRGPAPAVELWLNGTRLDTVDITHDGQVSEVMLPPGVAATAVDRLELRFAGPAMATADFAASQAAVGWPVGDTGARLPAGVPVAVRSAGEEVGDFAHIYVAGEDVAPNSRGYNLVALDGDGQVLDATVFDTLAGAGESAAMATWLDRWPAGTLVAGAVADEASLNLGEDAVTALRRYGVTTDLRGKFRWSHAFIGAAGAPPASALETASLLQPAAVYAGVPVDGPAVSGGVSRVEFQP